MLFDASAAAAAAVALALAVLVAVLVAVALAVLVAAEVAAEFLCANRSCRSLHCEVSRWMRDSSAFRASALLWSTETRSIRCSAGLQWLGQGKPIAPKWAIASCRVP